MTESPVACPWCKATKYIPREKLTKHMQTRHNSSFFKYFPRIKVYSRDTDDPFQCERVQEFLCDICSKSFKEHSAYKTHLKSIHNRYTSSDKDMPAKENVGLRDGLECSICFRKFKFERTFELHMRTRHKPNKPGSVENNKPARENLAHSLRKRKYINNACENSIGSCEVEEKLSKDEGIGCIEVSPNRIATRESIHAHRLKEKRKFLCSLCRKYRIKIFISSIVVRRQYQAGVSRI